LAAVVFATITPCTDIGEERLSTIPTLNEVGIQGTNLTPPFLILLIAFCISTTGNGLEPSQSTLAEKNLSFVDLGVSHRHDPASNKLETNSLLENFFTSFLLFLKGNRDTMPYRKVGSGTKFVTISDIEAFKVERCLSDAVAPDTTRSIIPFTSEKDGLETPSLDRQIRNAA
jgi:hypothetical protein